MNSIPETPAPASPTPPSRRRWRWWRRFALTLAVLITLTALFYAVEDFRGWRAWRNEVALLKQHGEPLTWAELVPPLPPEEENLAFAPPFRGLLDYRLTPTPEDPAHTEGAWEECLRKAKISLAPPGYGQRPELAGWSRGQRVDLAAWARHFRHPQSTNRAPVHFPLAPPDASPAEQVLTALQLYAPQMAAIRQACERPKAQFPVHYEENFYVLLPHLSVLRDFSRVFTLHGVAELRQGNTAAALADLRVLRKLRDALHPEPMLISQLVRVALQHTLLQVVWEGMVEHRWSPADWDQIRAALDAENFLSDFLWALRGERIGAINALEQFCQGKLSWDMLSPSSGNAPLFSPYYLVPSGWIRQNMVRLSRYYQELMAAVGDTNRLRVDWTVPQTVAQQLSREHASPYNIFVKLLAPALEKIFPQAAEAQAETHLALTAGALEQRFRRTGRYPETLAEVAGGEPPRWMRDPFDGQPLRYRRSAPDACLLYSIGPNRKDDHGTPRRARQPKTEGDLIWRLPPRAAESETGTSSSP